MPLKDNLVTEVRAGLDQVYDEANGTWDRPEWTRQVKTAVCEACRTVVEGCYLAAAGVAQPPADEGEWLFDVICLQYDNDRHQKRVVLAAECEWSNKEGELWRDFEKLLVVRAEVRVMIYNGNIWGTNNPGFARFIGRSEQTRECDTYLFAGYTSEGFKYVRIDALQNHILLN